MYHDAGEEAMKWIIVDLDDTLCDGKHRKPLAVEKRWDDYHAHLGEDQPRRAEKVLVQAWVRSSSLHRVALVTGRPERYRSETEDWLSKNKIDYDELHMRKDDDFGPNWRHKERVFKNHFFGIRDVVFVLEDQDNVVKMWRGLGLTCFQVQPGDYHG
jgi:FMN phosphatase YigB (HAD superfamily)